MNQLPDLPALEAVETRTRERPVLASIAFLFVAGFTGLGVRAYIRLGDYARDLLPQVTVAAVLAGGICAWIVYRLILADFHWRTNADGLHSRSLIRRRFRRWEDMSSLTRLSGKSATTYDSRLVSVDASVWQHMRRLGKADDTALPEPALTFWDVIPDELPTELQWRNPRPIRRNYIIWCTLSGVVLAAGLGLVVSLCFGFRFTDVLFQILICCLYGPLLSSAARMNKMQPEHILLGGKHMQMWFMGRTLNLAPDEVTHAWWGDLGILHLRTSTAHFTIPLDSIYDASSMMVLAIIRWLRLAAKPKPIVIPEILRSTFEEKLRSPSIECNGDDRVEVRLGRADQVAVVFLALVFAAPLTGLALQNSDTSVIAAVVTLAAVFASAVTWWLTGNYVLYADGSGTTKSFLWWRKSVEWRDVAAYTVGNKAGSGTQNRSMRCILWSRDGRSLMCFSTNWTSAKTQWQHFAGFMFARLAETLPDGKITKPWKSRPY